MARLRLKKSEELKEELMNKSKTKINNLYKELAKDVAEKIKKYELMPNSATKNLQLLRLNQLYKEILPLIQKTNSSIEDIIKTDVEKISSSVQDEMNEFLEKIKLGYKFAHIKEDVIESIVNGLVYNKEDFLSKRIWSITKKQLDDINSIIAKGVADGTPIYDIAKDLEKYVNPNAKKLWDWSKVYPNTNKVVDYNAQRLARTLIQHAFQQSFERAGENNPFIEDYIWLSALAHGRTCQLCRDRHGQHFKKNELPLDHPNGLCTWAYSIKDLRSVAKDINKWREAPKGTYPDIDKFAETLEPLYKGII